MFGCSATPTDWRITRLAPYNWFNFTTTGKKTDHETGRDAGQRFVRQRGMGWDGLTTLLLSICCCWRPWA